MATLQNGEKKKKRIDDPGFFSAGFLSNGVLFFFFFLFSLVELSFLPQFLILLTDPQSLQGLILKI